MIEPLEKHLVLLCLIKLNVSCCVTCKVDIPFLGLQSIGMQAYVCQEMYIRIFMTVLFKMALDWKHSLCP